MLWVSCSSDGVDELMLHGIGEFVLHGVHALASAWENALTERP